MQEVVEELVRQHGGSQRKLAEALDISMGHLSNLKHGNFRMAPERKTLQKLGVRRVEHGYEWLNRPNGKRIPPGWGFR